MVMIGSSLAAAGGSAPASSTTGASGPTSTNSGKGNPTSDINPAGHVRQRKCKKRFRGPRRHRKCRHAHKGHGTLHAPGQQK
jgi:hypothetical protein